MADGVMPSRQRHLVLTLLLAGSALAMLAFVGLGLRGNIAFVLSLRASQLLAIVQVAVSIAISTVVFQTISGNRLISPSIMGMDALYIFGQTGLIFVLGGLGFAAVAPQAKFAVEVTAMMALSAAIFLPLLDNFGIDPLFFGIMVALNLQTSFLSPPIAMAPFYLKGVAPKGVTIEQIFAGVMPFLGIVVVCLLILYVFPDVALWLPDAVYN